MAAAAGRDLERAGALGGLFALRAVRAGLAAGAVEYLRDRSFRPVRAAAGLGSVARQPLRAARVQEPLLLPDGAPSALSWLRDRVLGNPDDEFRALTVRRRHHGLHPARDPVRGAGSRCGARRQLSSIPW